MEGLQEICCIADFSIRSKSDIKDCKHVKTGGVSFSKDQFPKARTCNWIVSILTCSLESLSLMVLSSYASTLLQGIGFRN